MDMDPEQDIGKEQATDSTLCKKYTTPDPNLTVLELYV